MQGTGWISGQVRFHTLWSNQAPGPLSLSQHSKAFFFFLSAIEVLKYALVGGEQVSLTHGIGMNLLLSFSSFGCTLDLLAKSHFAFFTCQMVKLFWKTENCLVIWNY